MQCHLYFKSISVWIYPTSHQIGFDSRQKNSKALIYRKSDVSIEEQTHYFIAMNLKNKLANHYTTMCHLEKYSFQYKVTLKDIYREVQVSYKHSFTEIY